jgi:hypothetical protein
VLCLQPNPPTLICIDEPDQGVHHSQYLVIADRCPQCFKPLVEFLAGLRLIPAQAESAAAANTRNRRASLPMPPDRNGRVKRGAQLG